METTTGKDPMQISPIALVSLIKYYGTSLGVSIASAYNEGYSLGRSSRMVL